MKDRRSARPHFTHQLGAFDDPDLSRGLVLNDEICEGWLEDSRDEG